MNTGSSWGSSEDPHEGHHEGELERACSEENLARYIICYYIK